MFSGKIRSYKGEGNVKRMIIAIFVLSMSILTSCTDKEKIYYIEKDIEKDKEFNILSKESILSDGVADDEIIIIEHKETGNKYIVYRGYRKGGITPLND